MVSSARLQGRSDRRRKERTHSLRWLAQQPGGKHPAADYDDLPDEVRSYIIKLEIELHDERGTLLMGRVLVATGLGAFLLASYFGWISTPINRRVLNAVVLNLSHMLEHTVPESVGLRGVTNWRPNAKKQKATFEGIGESVDRSASRDESHGRQSTDRN